MSSHWVWDSVTTSRCWILPCALSLQSSNHIRQLVMLDFIRPSYQCGIISSHVDNLFITSFFKVLISLNHFSFPPLIYCWLHHAGDISFEPDPLVPVDLHWFSQRQLLLCHNTGLRNSSDFPVDRCALRPSQIWLPLEAWHRFKDWWERSTTSFGMSVYFCTLIE